MKGQKLFKTSSTLMIFGGAACFLIGCFALFGTFNVTNLKGAALTLMSILAILGGAAEFLGGSIGTKASTMPDPSKIKYSFMLGILTLLFSLIVIIYSLAKTGGLIDIAVIVHFFAGLIIAIMYLVGLTRFKNALDDLIKGK